MPELITVEVEGLRYSGWKQISVRRSLEALSTAFTLTASDRWFLEDEQWVLYPGESVKVLIGEAYESVCWGYIDSVDANTDGTVHELRLGGRDRTADLVDCSVATTPAKWRNQDILGLVRALCQPFGLGVTLETAAGARFAEFATKQGEAPFEAMMRAATQRGVLLVAGREGNVRIINAGSERAVDALELPGNVLSAGSRYDFTDRFSEYSVRGQSKAAGDGWDSSAVSIEGVANDQAVTRYRPKVITASGITTTVGAKAKAAWEANARAARSFKANVVVRDWRQSNGALWDAGLVVPVRIPQLLLDGDMVVSAVEWSQSEGGTFTTMELTRPDAYEREPAQSVAAQRDLGWD